MTSQVSEVVWNGWPAVRLADAAISLVVLPGLGGRVVSLRDVRTHREWLVQGRPPDPAEAGAWSREDVVFSGLQSFGWDECLPTVAPCDDPLDASAPRLRDHGDLWGRPTDVRGDQDAITTTWTPARWGYRLRRRLSLEGDGAVRADYDLVSLADRTLPLLWSMHPTLALEAGSHIELPGEERVRLTWATGSPSLAGDSVAWPLATAQDGSTVDLGRVRRPDGSAAKCYASRARLGRVRAADGDLLELSWDASRVPAVGVWLDFGGWPVGGPPVEQVALEPTSSSDDHLCDAMAHERAWTLAPAATLHWWVRLTSIPRPAVAA